MGGRISSRIHFHGKWDSLCNTLCCSLKYSWKPCLPHAPVSPLQNKFNPTHSGHVHTMSFCILTRSLCRVLFTKSPVYVCLNSPSLLLLSLGICLHTFHFVRPSSLSLSLPLPPSLSQPLLEFKDPELRKLGVINSRDRSAMLASLASYRPSLSSSSPLTPREEPSSSPGENSTSLPQSPNGRVFPLISVYRPPHTL